jgi:predicted SAM-dependent methyltransferase
MWQARLAGRRALAWLASRLTGRRVGHWPSGIVCRDVRRGLRFGSATVAAMFSSHFIEPLYRDEALALLHDVRRVLTPAGVCCVIVPDVAAIVGWYLAHRAGPAGVERRPRSDMLMEMLSVRPRSALCFRIPREWCRQWTDFESHHWIYDAERLIHLFREAGFANPEPRVYLNIAISASAPAVVEHADRMQDGSGVCVEARR